MATRIESGQMQLRGVGGVPMQQVTPREVDFVGFRAEAQAANTLSQLVDRMSQTAFQMAGEAAQTRAMFDVATNRITPAQIEAAKNGDMSFLGRGSQFNIYDATVRKARAFELSSAFETEAKAEVVKIMADIENGKIGSDKVAEKLNTVTNGFARSLANVDADAALKFTASMGVYSNTVMAEAYKKEQQREREKNVLLLDSDYTNSMKLVDAALQQGFFVDANGQEQPIEILLDVYRKNLTDHAFSVGGLATATEFRNRFDKDLAERRVNVATKIVLDEEFMANPNVGMERILAGDLGRFSPVWQKMDENEKKAVRDNFSAAVRARKEGIELNLANSQRQGDEILRQIYLAQNPAQMNALFSQMQGLPVNPSTLNSARTFIRQMSTEGRANDDLSAFGRVTQRIALGLATEDEIINGPFSNNTKRSLMGAMANPGNSINAATNMINLGVNIQSADLPPEFSDAATRELAVRTRSELVMQLHGFARTPDINGRLPDNNAIMKEGQRLQGEAKQRMSGAFKSVAETNRSSAVMMIPELRDVDLMNEAAVADAIAQATKRKASSINVQSARSSIDNYRKNMNKLGDQK